MLMGQTALASNTFVPQPDFPVVMAVCVMYNASRTIHTASTPQARAGRIAHLTSPTYAVN
jgi:hypothetical protein